MSEEILIGVAGIAEYQVQRLELRINVSSTIEGLEVVSNVIRLPLGFFVIRKNKGRSGWKTTDTYSYCPLHRKVVLCVIVNWMHSWLRCPECLLKLPSKYSFDEPYLMIPTVIG